MPNRGRESEGVPQIRFSSPFLARKGVRGMIESVLRTLLRANMGAYDSTTRGVSAESSVALVSRMK